MLHFTEETLFWRNKKCLTKIYKYCALMFH